MRVQLHGSSGMKFVLSAWAIAACAGLAMGEPKGADTPAGEKPGHGEVLGGPKVKDDAKPGEMGKFAGREGRRDEIPHAMVVRVLKQMATDKVPADVRLTSDQVATIDELEKGYQESLEAYRKQNHDEVAKLREVLPAKDRGRVDGMMGEKGPKGEKGEKGEKGANDGAKAAESDKPAASREEVEKAKGRLKEIGDAAPKAGPVNEKMYGVLNDAQRAYAKKDVEKQRDEMRKRAEERKGGERMSPAVREQIEKLSPEERARFDKMSPEEKQAFIRKLMGK